MANIPTIAKNECSFSLTKYRIEPTVNELRITGTIPAKARCLKSEINKQLANVASVPKTTSNNPRFPGPKRLARKHPIVIPKAYSRLKKQSSTKASAILT